MKHKSTLYRGTVYLALLMVIGLLAPAVKAVHAKTLPSKSAMLPPEPPSLPSRNPNDYILNLYYMFFTYDFSLLNKIVGPQGTQFHFPYGVGFSPKGSNNQRAVSSEFSKASGLYGSQCLGIDPAAHGKFTIFFDGIHFKGVKENTYTYFLFMSNRTGDWELMVIGFIEKKWFDAMAPSLDKCPANWINHPPDERGCPDWFLSGNTAGLEKSTDKVNQDTDAKSKSFWERLFPQAYASDLCTPRRKPFDDKNDQFMQCTEYAQKMRPDALCWLAETYAHAHTWDDGAIKYGKEIVKVDDEPMIGDIVVWNTDCGGQYAVYGHVAIVTATYKDANGKMLISVQEANGDSTGKIGTRKNIPVRDCMSFIHEPGVGFNTSTKEITNIEPVPQKKSWWETFLCFLNPWCH